MAHGFGSKALQDTAPKGGDGSKSDWFKLKVGAKVGETVANPIRILSWLKEGGQHGNGAGRPFVCIGKENKCPKCLESDLYIAECKGDVDKMKKNPHKVSVKYLCWILDLADLDENKRPKVKLAQFGWSVVGTIDELSSNEDWKERFENGIPTMKLTINGKKTGEQKQNVEYTVTPSPAADPLTEDLKEAVSKLDSVDKISFNLKKKQAKDWGIELQEPAYLGAPDAAPAEEPLGQDNTKVEDIPF